MQALRASHAGDMPLMVHLNTMNHLAGFSERKCVVFFLAQVDIESQLLVATATRSKASERNLGECVVHWHVWNHGLRNSHALLQARYKVRLPFQTCHEPELISCIYCTSIQTWALKEAKERMDARGEKYQYEPQTSSSSRPS